MSSLWGTGHTLLMGGRRGYSRPCTGLQNLDISKNKAQKESAHNNSSKWIIDTNTKSKTIKLLGENIEVNFLDLVLNNIF